MVGYGPTQNKRKDGEERKGGKGKEGEGMRGKRGEEGGEERQWRGGREEEKGKEMKKIYACPRHFLNHGATSRPLS